MEPQAAQKSIAIINDDVNQLRLLEKILSSQPYHIDTFTGAEDALKRIDPARPPDMIITDLAMPGIDGWRFCRLLRSPEYSPFNPIPILVVSATFSGDDACRITADTGANGFLPMPVDRKSLIATVKAMLEEDYHVQKSRVLIVDDTLSIIAILKDAFESNSYDVHVAHDGLEAGQAFETGTFDFIVLDYHLPDTTGEALLSEFHVKQPDAVIIMITTDPDPDLALRWLQKGASVYIRKPFAPEYLLEMCAKTRREKSLFRVERILEERTTLLRENEQRLNSLLNNLTDVVWSISLPDLKTLYISPSVEKLYGRSAQEFIENPSLWQELTHPDDRLLNEEVYAQVLQNGEAVRECRIIRSDGSIAWILDKSKLVFDSNHQPVRIEGIASDITSRKQVEEELLQSESFLSKSQEIAHVGTWVLNLQDNRLVWSDEVYRIMGLRPQEFVPDYDRFLDFVHPDDRDKVYNDYLESVIEGTDSYDIQHRIVRRQTGEIRFVQEKCIHERDAAGVVVRSVGMIQDISDRKTAEDALQNQFDLQKLVAEISSRFVKFGSELLDNSIYAALRQIGEFFDADRSYVVLFSEDYQTMDNTHEWCAEGVEPRIGRIKNFPVSRFAWMFQELKNKRPVHIADIESLPEEASEEKALFRSYGIKSLICFPMVVQKKIIGFMGLHSFRTEEFRGEGQRALLWVVAEIIAGAMLRKQAGEELMRFRAAMDNSAEQIFLIDRDKMHFIDVNVTACNVLNFTKEELLSMGPQDIKPYYTYEMLAAEFDKIIQDKSMTGVVETIHQTKDGTQIPVEVRLQAFESLGKKFIIAVARDITERKKAEEEILNAKNRAEEASLAKSRFLSNMSHEIRTPIAGILGLLNMLDKKETDTEHKRMIGLITESAHSLLNIINDILDISKVEAGKMELSNEDFSLKSVLERTVSLYSVTASNKGVKLIYKTEAGVPDSLYGDPNRLEQILKNVISNAIKFTEKGEILVNVSIAPSSDSRYHLLFEVKDTGIGIPDNLMPKLFQSFTQADSSHTKKYGGTGLGLAISRQLAELMGGRMWAESKQGAGSTFFFKAVFQQGRVQQMETGDAPTGTKDRLPALRILVVEDVEINQEYITFILNEAGHQAVVVSNGVEAVQAYEKGRFDLVLMDIQMPEMDGMEATGEIRLIERSECRPRTPVIALTAYAIKEEQDNIMQAGMDGYVTKPIEPERLFSEIRRVMTGRTPVGKKEEKPERDKPALADLPLNKSLAEKRYGGRLELWQKMVHRFIETASQQYIDDLRQVMEEGDFKRIYSRVHTIKGSLGVICAEKAMEIAKELEEHARNGQLSECKQKHAALEAEFERIKRVKESFKI